jgi:hypothetical protein
MFQLSISLLNHVVTVYIPINPTFNSTNQNSSLAAFFTRTKAEPYTLDDPGRIHLNPPKTKKRKAMGPKNHKVADRADLQARLGDWLASSHATDPLRAVRPKCGLEC